MPKALDHLEKSLGLTLTGPVRELVNTRIVNVLCKSLGVIARNEQSLDVVVLPAAAELGSAAGADDRLWDGCRQPSRRWISG